MSPRVFFAITRIAKVPWTNHGNGGDGVRESEAPDAHLVQAHRIAADSRFNTGNVGGRHDFPDTRSPGCTVVSLASDDGEDLRRGVGRHERNLGNRLRRDRTARATRTAQAWPSLQAAGRPAARVPASWAAARPGAVSMTGRPAPRQARLERPRVESGRGGGLRVRRAAARLQAEQDQAAVNSQPTLHIDSRSSVILPAFLSKPARPVR